MVKGALYAKEGGQPTLRRGNIPRGHVVLADKERGCARIAQPQDDDASQGVYSVLRRLIQPTRPVPIMPSRIAPGAGTTGTRSVKNRSSNIEPLT